MGWAGLIDNLLKAIANQPGLIILFVGLLIILSGILFTPLGFGNQVVVAILGLFTLITGVMVQIIWYQCK